MNSQLFKTILHPRVWLGLVLSALALAPPLVHQADSLVTNNLFSHPETWALFWVPLPKLRGFIRQPISFIFFLFAFLKAFIKANLEVAYTVLFVSREDIHPAFLDYDIAHLERMELLLLSQCITLTPGTISVAVSEDLKTLTIHALHGKDVKSVKESIKQELETPMLRFMR